VSVAYQHVREEPVPPSHIDPDVPAAADAIVLRALTKDREERYQTADEMRADIRSALAGRPVAPPPATQRIAAVPGGAVPTSTFPMTTDTDDQRDKSGRTLAYALLGLAVLAVFVIAALVGNSLFGGGGNRVAVPEVVGFTQARAEAAVTDAGLTVGEVTQANSDTVDKGLVISQSPEPGTEIDEQAAVSLVVSSGAKESAVPTLVGLSLDEARNALIDAGLQLGDVKRVPSPENRNTVVKATPREGTTVPVDSRVNLEVASGENKVPNVKGKTAEEARSILQQAGFEVEERERESADAAPGTVVDQTPNAGRNARLESTVRIFVATAPPSPSPSETVSPTITITG
jgi:serine/threonine-protein kinase